MKWPLKQLIDRPRQYKSRRPGLARLLLVVLDQERRRESSPMTAGTSSRGPRWPGREPYAIMSGEKSHPWRRGKSRALPCPPVISVITYALLFPYRIQHPPISGLQTHCLGCAAKKVCVYQPNFADLGNRRSGPWADPSGESPTSPALYSISVVSGASCPVVLICASPA